MAPPFSSSERRQQQQQSDLPIDSFRFSSHQDQTTLVLGVINHLERLESEISEMKDFVNLGFKRIETIGEADGGIAATIEEHVVVF